MLNSQTLFKNGMLFFLSFCILHSAFSATYSTGGGKKNETNKKVIAPLNLKNNSLSFSNGYRFRSGMNFTNTSKSIVFKSNSIRFQKGNSLYIIPVKQKIIISKFIVPQKSIK